MNKQDMIKYALIAVGAYLVYKWLTQPGWFLAVNQSAAAQIPGDTAATPASTSATTPAKPAETPATPPPDADRKTAAYDSSKASITGSFTLNAHEWNWYRAAKANELGTFDQAKHQPTLDNYGDPNLQYTATEYHALLAKAGLAGLGYGWGLPVGMNGWAN